MTAARVRFIVAVALFVVWISWLAWLAVTTANPIVLSRPQFLAADAWVIAHLKGDGEHPDPNITIKQVVWADDEAKDLAEGMPLEIVGLNMPGWEQFWQGPGDYILPLTKNEIDRYRLTPIPFSPGFPPPGVELTLRDRLLIYPVTPRTLEQLESLAHKRTQQQ